MIFTGVMYESRTKESCEIWSENRPSDHLSRYCERVGRDISMMEKGYCDPR